MRREWKRPKSASCTSGATGIPASSLVELAQVGFACVPMSFPLLQTFAGQNISKCSSGHQTGTCDQQPAGVALWAFLDGYMCLEDLTSSNAQKPTPTTPAEPVAPSAHAEDDYEYVLRNGVRPCYGATGAARKYCNELMCLQFCFQQNRFCFGPELIHVIAATTGTARSAFSSRRKSFLTATRPTALARTPVPAHRCRAEATGEPRSGSSSRFQGWQTASASA